MKKKYSKDIFSDRETYYMGCPEKVSEHIAKELSSFNEAIELCCGAGMISIQLAKHMNKVIGIEINEERVRYAEKNAELYNVSENTEFIQGNATNEELLKKTSAEVAVLDPDWSSSGNKKNQHVSNLEKTQPNLKTLFNLTKKHITTEIVVRAPKTLSYRNLSQLGNCKIENIHWNNELKFKIAYYLDEVDKNTEKDIEFTLV